MMLIITEQLVELLKAKVVWLGIRNLYQFYLGIKDLGPIIIAEVMVKKLHFVLWVRTIFLGEISFLKINVPIQIKLGTIF